MLYSYPVAQGRFSMHRSILVVSIIWIISNLHHLILLTYNNQPWSPFFLLLGPILYFTTGFTPRMHLSRHLVHVFPFALAMIAAICGFDPSSLTAQHQYLLIGILALPYLIATLKKLTKGSATGINKDAIIFSTIAFSFSCGWYLALGLIDQAKHAELGLDLRVFPVGGMAMATFGYLCCSTAGNAQDLITLEQHPGTDPTIPYQRTKIQQDQLANYLQMIDHYLVESQHYLDPMISPQRLAGKLNIPRHLLSPIFNQHIGHRFYNYIAILRINHAKKLIAGASYQHKVDSLAQECGFSSSTSFYRHFRQQTGLSPYRYICQKGSVER